MFSAIGFKEILVILLLLLLLFGHKKLKNLCKTLGEGLRDFRKGLEGETEQQAPKEKASSTENASPAENTAPDKALSKKDEDSSKNPQPKNTE